LTQTKLALRLGVSQQTIAAWERGDRPRPEHVITLAKYLEWSEHELAEELEVDSLARSMIDAPEAASQPMLMLTQAFVHRARSGPPLTADEAALFRDLIAYHSRPSPSGT
jgi:transcriptional regulator with XRE-family HTH domain